MNRSDYRIIVAGSLAVMVLLPLHFFAERPYPTVLSTATVLLIFFAPLALAALRIQYPSGNLFWQSVAYLRSGIVLGVFIGVVGSLEKGLLHFVTGEPLHIPAGLWITIAVFFALATGLAYGVMLCLVRGLGALLRSPSPEVLSSLFADIPSPSRWRGLLYSVIPGLGHFALGRSSRGRPFLLVSLVSGLCGLVVETAGLILLVEGGIPTLPLLVLGAVFILLPAALALVSALDLFLASAA